MNKIKVWNDWCNDKAVVYNKEGLPIVFSGNQVVALEGFKDGDEDFVLIYTEHGHVIEAVGSVEDAIKELGERVVESQKRIEERRKKAAEEAWKEQEELQKRVQALGNVADQATEVVQKAAKK